MFPSGSSVLNKLVEALFCSSKSFEQMIAFTLIFILHPLFRSWVMNCYAYFSELDYFVFLPLNATCLIREGGSFAASPNSGKQKEVHSTIYGGWDDTTRHAAEAQSEEK